MRLQLDESSGTREGCGRTLAWSQSEINRTSSAFGQWRKSSDAMPGASGLGRGLARRLAPRVMVDDQGRISVQVGARQVPGTSIRRKSPGACSCFLLTRPDFSCTRDQVLDALWPELDPARCVELPQPDVYFLRRVFEEDYNDDLSPGYVHHESDVIWLDQDSCHSASATCCRMIRQMAPGSDAGPGRGAVGSVYGADSRSTSSTRTGQRRSATGSTPHISQIVERAVAQRLESADTSIAGYGSRRRALDVDAYGRVRSRFRCCACIERAAPTLLQPSSTPTTRRDCARSSVSSLRHSNRCRDR